MRASQARSLGHWLLKYHHRSRPSLCSLISEDLQKLYNSHVKPSTRPRKRIASTTVYIQPRTATNQPNCVLGRAPGPCQPFFFLLLLGCSSVPDFLARFFFLPPSSSSSSSSAMQSKDRKLADPMGF